MANLRPRPGILEIEPYVGGKSELAGAGRVIKLSANESALGPSPSAVAALQEAALSCHRYPDGDALALRAAIALGLGPSAASLAESLTTLAVPSTSALPPT